MVSVISCNQSIFKILVKIASSIEEIEHCLSLLGIGKRKRDHYRMALDLRVKAI